ncbi:MAG: hypothetical protein J6T10_22090 [Methanobrevibacter sp.]|nr:hypothetical protein [Methanobrevibacter sp.]
MTCCKSCIFYDGKICTNHCQLVMYPIKHINDPYGKSYDYIDYLLSLFWLSSSAFVNMTKNAHAASRSDTAYCTK